MISFIIVTFYAAIKSQQFPTNPNMEKDARRFITQKFNNATKKKLLSDCMTT
jgi:hypothetical protein